MNTFKIETEMMLNSIGIEFNISSDNACIILSYFFGYTKILMYYPEKYQLTHYDDLDDLVFNKIENLKIPLIYKLLQYLINLDWHFQSTLPKSKISKIFGKWVLKFSQHLGQFYIFDIAVTKHIGTLKIDVKLFFLNLIVRWKTPSHYEIVFLNWFEKLQSKISQLTFKI